MARNILCAFIALNFFVSGKNVPETKSDSAKKDSAADPDKKGGDSDSASGVIIMPSGYECRSPDPSWCHLLEKHDLNKKYAKTREEYQKFVLHQFDSGSYDNRTRPGFSEGKPDLVRVRLYIESLGPASESEMSFFQDIYMTQIWADHRLNGTEKMNYTSGISSPFAPGIVHSLWTPDTYFRNGIHTEIVQTHENQIGMIVKINTDGQINVTKRLRVKSKCLMFLEYFPFDRQLCELEISSFSYDNQDIVFKWAEDPLEFNENLVLSEFDFLEHRFVVRLFKIPSMPHEQTILVLQYVLHRQVGFYIGQIFLPSTLIVFVSWVTFYINPGVVPARASVGITCVLTMMTLTTSCIGSLPTNLMYTPVDIYLGACFMFVFGALIEFAIVNFSETSYKRRKDRVEKLRNKAMGASIFPASGGTNSLKGEDRDSFQSQVTPLNNNNNGAVVSAENRGFAAKNGAIPTIEMPMADFDVEDKSCWANIAADPMAIDYFSRFLYPICFFIFNVIYWTATLTLSKSRNEEILQNVEIAARINN